ncbi:MAG: alpha/beta hydrolase [Luteolibacter sp.]
MKTLLILLSSASLLLAAESPILLWPAGAPGSEGKTGDEIVTKSASGELSVSNIHKPSITPYLPSKESSTGAAVIIAPGGGHKLLCVTHEGSNVAEWLAQRGIAAFVLKNRLAEEPGSTYTVDGDAVADLHRAIRLVRSRAAEWNINPAAVGVMGFSAGGEVCSIGSMNFDAAKPDAVEPLEKFSDRPDFQALIYPGRSSRIVPFKDSPPAFLAASSNDRKDISEGLLKVYLDFKTAGVPVELHLYAGGGHGFGYRPARNSPVDQWIVRFQEWMKDRKFIAELK